MIASVNDHETMLSRTVPHGTVPHRRGSPDQYKMVPLTIVNSSIPLASNPIIIFSELIGICDAILSHTTSSHHIDDCEILQDSRGTLAVNRHIKIVVKSSTT